MKAAKLAGGQRGTKDLCCSFFISNRSGKTRSSIIKNCCIEKKKKITVIKEFKLRDTSLKLLND